MYLCASFMHCGCGVIGSRARLRIWCRETWGFESLHPHKIEESCWKAAFFYSQWMKGREVYPPQAEVPSSAQNWLKLLRSSFFYFKMKGQTSNFIDINILLLQTFIYLVGFLAYTDLVSAESGLEFLNNWFYTQPVINRCFSEIFLSEQAIQSLLKHRKWKRQEKFYSGFLGLSL